MDCSRFREIMDNSRMQSKELDRILNDHMRNCQACCHWVEAGCTLEIRDEVGKLMIAALLEGAREEGRAERSLRRNREKKKKVDKGRSKIHLIQPPLDDEE